MKIEWLDTVCGVQIDTGHDEIYTDVYDSNGNILAHDFHKGNLSALIAELTFELPPSVADDRNFCINLTFLISLVLVLVRNTRSRTFIQFFPRFLEEEKWPTCSTSTLAH